MSGLRGVLELPLGPLPERAARVLVELRDVGLQDAPAPLLASVELHDVALSGGQIRFRLAGVPDLSGRQVAVRAHVDFGGTGQIDPGDLLTTRHVPVGDPGSELRVPVERV